MAMRGCRWGTVAWLAVATGAGCTSGPPHRSLASAEPHLAAPGDPSAAIATPAPSPAVSFVDRHPLLSKPREYYETTPGSYKATRVAAAAVIGVPAGFLGEMRQIIVGQPPGSD